MRNLKSILVIAALAFVTTTSNVSFANKENAKKVDSCTATVTLTSGGVIYTATATRATCSAARTAAIAMLP